MNTKREALISILVGIESLRAELEKAQKTGASQLDCMAIVDRLAYLYMSIDTNTAIEAMTGKGKMAS